jgi:hypothetical protein
MGNQQLVSPSRQCSSKAVGFGQGFLSKEQYNTGALSWLQLIFTCSLERKQQLREGDFVMLLT